MMGNREKTLAFLEELGIKYEKVEHKVCYTMEDLDNEGVTKFGNVYKNFFLRNAKGNKHFVVSMPEHKKTNIQDIAKQIGSTRLSFGSDDRLQTHLKIEKGQVGPLSAINNEEKSVDFIFDKDVKYEEKLGIHPNDNTMTIFISYADLVKVFEKLGVEMQFVEI